MALTQTRTFAVTTTALDLAAEPTVEAPDPPAEGLAAYPDHYFVENVGLRTVYWSLGGAAPVRGSQGHELAPGASMTIELLSDSRFWVWGPATGTVKVSPAGRLPVRTQ
ncbi:MAG: hypothetical protein OXI15_03100 [Chromatiales bacterium]|nr:hypothetical protein [Chromatiales bacterium]